MEYQCQDSSLLIFYRNIGHGQFQNLREAASVTFFLLVGKKGENGSCSFLGAPKNLTSSDLSSVIPFSILRLLKDPVRVFFSSYNAAIYSELLKEVTDLGGTIA